MESKGEGWKLSGEVWRIVSFTDDFSENVSNFGGKNVGLTPKFGEDWRRLARE